jgi:hypothetical protein
MKYLLPLALCIFLACNEEIENTNNSEQSSIDEVALATIVEEVAPVPVEVVKELTYDEVILSQNIQDIKNFINKNPSHPDIDNLKKHLIDVEVDEIINDEKTGKMPESQKMNFETSDVSEINIENSTGCELTVRYSGVDSRMIVINDRNSNSISLNSGYYKVAASACGLNYAGTESLNGIYSSKFYISRSRF